MKPFTMSEETKFETRVYMPSELSIVVTRRPLPPLDRLVPLEECIKICAAVSIKARTRYLPNSGTTRTERLPLIPYLPSYDARACCGAFDANDESGRRICNWVRFLKVSPYFTQEVNIVGQNLGSRKEVLFEIIQDIPPGTELVAYIFTPINTDRDLGGMMSLLPHSLFSDFHQIDTSDKPLDLSKSLKKTERSTSPRRSPLFISRSSLNPHDRIKRPRSPRSPRSPRAHRRVSSSESDEVPYSEESSSVSSPRSEISVSPHAPSVSPISQTGFLPHNLAFSNAASVLFGHHSLGFPITSVFSGMPNTIPTPPSSSSGSPKESVWESPPPPAPKRRERAMLPCSVCGKAFDRPSLLKRHMRTHTGEKPHICDVCGKGFSTSSSLNTHRRIHSGEKPHKCHICSKRFTASSNLYYHKMTHVKEKPHKCTMCTRSFPTPGDLRSHMFVHNGQWPHKCGDCGKGFSKITNLRNHSLLHTNKPHLNTPPPSTLNIIESEA